MSERPCSRCEFHKAKSNKHPGKLIPGMHGKCARPEGLCDGDGPAPAMIVGDASGIPAPAAPAPAPAGGFVGDPSAWREALAKAPAPGPEDPRLCAATPPARLTEAELEEVQGEANALHAAEVAAMEAYDVMKAVGRIEGIDFLRRVGDVALAQTFVEIRQSKKYKGMQIRDADGKVRRVRDFEDFCKAVLGKSYPRCAELAQNLHLLGPSLYEAAEKMGLANKDYRAMRALPEEAQRVVKEAIAAESKEQVLDLLQDLAAQNAAKVEALEKKAADQAADLEARDRLLKDKGERLEKKELELARLKSLPPAENVRLRLATEKQAVEDLKVKSIAAIAAMNDLLAHVEEVLAADVSIHTQVYCADTVRMVVQSLADLMARHGVDVDVEAVVVPAWTRDTAKEEITAAVEGARA